MVCELCSNLYSQKTFANGDHFNSNKNWGKVEYVYASVFVQYKVDMAKSKRILHEVVEFAHTWNWVFLSGKVVRVFFR